MVDTETQCELWTMCRREGATLSGRLCAGKVVEAADSLSKKPEGSRAREAVSA